MKKIIPLDNLSDAEKGRLKKLTRAPELAWPTVMLCVLLVMTYGCVYFYCLAGLLPLWVGMLANSIVGYVAFSVGHDAIHRSISKNKRINDLIGQIGLLLVLPYVDIRLFRWTHILHHRFAGGDRDPDQAFNGAWYTLPFRWMFIDVAYFLYAMKNADKISKPFLKNSIRIFALVAIVIASLSYAGYGKEILMLWFIPSRFILMFLGFSFFWLPHVPHNVSQEENFTLATTIREGHEWLLGPVLQYQNYHLVHHLYPTTPFYNNYKVFQLLESEIRKKDLAIQVGFAIRPKVQPGEK